MPLKKKGSYRLRFWVVSWYYLNLYNEQLPSEKCADTTTLEQFFLSSFHIVVAAASISLVHIFLVEFVTMRVLSWSSLFHISLSYKKKQWFFIFPIHVHEKITEFGNLSLNYHALRVTICQSAQGRSGEQFLSIRGVQVHVLSKNRYIARQSSHKLLVFSNVQCAKLVGREDVSWKRGWDIVTCLVWSNAISQSMHKHSEVDLVR